MAGENENPDLDLRTTPRSYNRGGIWIFVTILLVLGVVAFAWTKLKDVVIDPPNTTTQSAPIPSTGTGQ